MTDVPRGRRHGGLLLHRSGEGAPAVVFLPGAGLVLLDPGHEDILDFLPEQATELADEMRLDPDDLPELTAEQTAASRAALRQLYAGWPDDVLEPLVEHHLTAWRTGIREAANLDTAVHEELRNGGDVPERPTVVLSAGGDNPYWAQFASPDFLREARAGMLALHAAMAGPSGEHRVAAGASHQYLSIERPDDVVDAVRDVVVAVR